MQRLVLFVSSRAMPWAVAEVVAELVVVVVLVCIVGAVASAGAVVGRVAAACSSSDRPAVRASAGQSWDWLAGSY